jgi:hypothetical protein
MTARRVHVGVVTGFAFGALLVWVGTTNAGRQLKPEKSIPLADLHDRPVVGSLGHPLGTIVTIEGEVADGSYTNLRKDEGLTLLRVHAVNGEKLAGERIFQFDSLLDRVRTPEVGTRFNFTGYETGGFTGIPTKAFDYVGLVQSTGYGFTTDFIVLRDEAKARD